MGGVPSKAGDPSTTKFQVIGAGYCRTGTVSMQLALETLLNGPVMHGGTHVQSREDSFPKKFLDAFEARRAGDTERTLKLLKDVTAGFAGCTDMPCIDFVPELVELYPEAKVVLVKRDPARWWNSVKPLMANATAWYLPVLTLPMPTTRWFPGIVREWKTHSDALLGGAPPGPDLIEAYNEWVIRSVPKDRLLVMGLGEGWAPLCKFLDKPIPNTPFPRANEAEAVEQYTNALLRRLASIWLGIGIATGGSVYLLWRFCRNP